MNSYRDIALICDDNYLMPTLVTIQSISSCCKNIQNYRFNICSFKLSERSKELINKSKANNIVIIEPPISLYERLFEKIQQKSHVTSVALLKFELPNLIDSDTVLYLDSDIIVNKDIGELFDIDLADNYLAASFEFMKYINQIVSEGNFEIPKFYFNSGVMLLNLKKMRNDNIMEQLWDMKINSDTSSNLMDQDVLNKCLSKSCIPLPLSYNYNVKFKNGIDVKLVNKIYHTNYKEICELKNDIKIYHYVGENDKPWIYENSSHVELWDKYYKESAFLYKDLNRKIYKKNLQYYVKILLSHIKQSGLRDAYRYVMCKVKHKF